MNSFSFPVIALLIVCSIFRGIIENGKHAISLGVSTQSESATQWIFAEKKSNQNLVVNHRIHTHCST